MKLIEYRPRILPKALIGVPGAGVIDDVVHAEPADETQRDENTSQIQPAFWIQVSEPAGIRPIRVPLSLISSMGHGRSAEDAHGHHQRNQDLHGGHTEVAQPRIQTQCQTLLALGKESADIAHRAGKVAAANTGQQGKQLKHPQRCALVLQGDTRPQCRNHQQGGGKDNGIAAAGNTDHERRGYAESGTGQSGNGGQGEQFYRLERKAEIEHLYRDDPPHHPYGESQQQAGNGNPQVTVGNRLPGILPERMILHVPRLDITVHLPPR